MEHTGRKIIKYNIISNKKNIIYQTDTNSSIDQYNIIDNDIIIEIIQNCKSKIIFNNNKIILDCNECLDVYLFRIRYEMWAAVTMIGYVMFYNLNGLMKRQSLNGIFYDISMVDQKILIYRPDFCKSYGAILIKNMIDVSDIESIFDFSGIISFVKVDKLQELIVNGYFVDCISWAQKSSRIGVVNLDNEMDLVINFDTKVSVLINNCELYVDAGNYLIGVESKYTEIYDVDSLILLKKVNNCFDYMLYNKELNLLISDTFDLYRINSKYDFEKITLGRNYINDRCIYENYIMEIILNNILWFDLLPMEILCTELYRGLLIVLD